MDTASSFSGTLGTDASGQSINKYDKLDESNSECVIKMWNPSSYGNAQIVNDRGTFGFYKERRT